jgi:hypothetical protein
MAALRNLVIATLLADVTNSDGWPSSRWRAAAACARCPSELYS